MLEEIGLPYEVHLVDFGKGDQRTPEYLSLNPYGKIPAIIDPAGPGGKPLPLFEWGRSFSTLRRRQESFCPPIPRRATRRSNGVLPDGGDGPDVRPGRLLSQIRRPRIEDKRPLHRYRDEAKRILAVIEARLAERSWIMGDEYTIADISMLGWVRNLIGFYGAGELVGFDELKRRPLAGARACAARGSARTEFRSGGSSSPELPPSRGSASPRRDRRRSLLSAYSRRQRLTLVA